MTLRDSGELEVNIPVAGDSSKLDSVGTAMGTNVCFKRCVLPIAREVIPDGFKRRFACSKLQVGIREHVLLAVLRLGGSRIDIVDMVGCFRAGVFPSVVFSKPKRFGV
jgi:hypothetical protein